MKAKDIISVSLLFAIIIIILVSAIYFFFTGSGQKEAAVNTEGWKSYINEHYAFSLNYPPEWELAESVTDPDAPVYMIYKPGEHGLPAAGTEDEIYPAIVSVYPLSSPVWNLSGSLRGSSVVFEQNVRNAYDYLLADGTRWATVVYFEDIPATWSDSGFVFSRMRISNLETECFRNGLSVTDEPCFPLSGDCYVRKGDVDIRDMVLLDAVLGSFRFIKNGSDDYSYKDLVRIKSPLPGSEISSPVYIAGEARGHWYLEAAFPLLLKDTDGKILSKGQARAVDKWMTTDYVPFEAVVSFAEEYPLPRRGSLVLEKGTPYGPGEDHDRFEIPVILASGEKRDRPEAGRCIVTGCSGQICSDEEVFTTCEYLPEYECYSSAKCERQADGYCGWTMTDELISCLEKKRALAPE